MVCRRQKLRRQDLEFFPIFHKERLCQGLHSRAIGKQFNFPKMLVLQSNGWSDFQSADDRLFPLKTKGANTLHCTYLGLRAMHISSKGPRLTPGEQERRKLRNRFPTHNPFPINGSWVSVTGPFCIIFLIQSKLKGKMSQAAALTKSVQKANKTFSGLQIIALLQFTFKGGAIPLA